MLLNLFKYFIMNFVSFHRWLSISYLKKMTERNQETTITSSQSSQLARSKWIWALWLPTAAAAPRQIRLSAPSKHWILLSNTEPSNGNSLFLINCYLIYLINLIILLKIYFVSNLVSNVF